MYYNLLINLFLLFDFVLINAIQFPSGSEELVLPNIAIISAIYGTIHLPQLPLILQSMKWNSPKVHYIIMNILPDNQNNPSNELLELIKKHDISNVQYEMITQSLFNSKIENKLGFKIAFNDEWKKKLDDYKPTYGALFNDLIPSEKYKYWGYAELDLVWGNITRYAYLFQGNYGIIPSDLATSAGPVVFYRNEPWSKSFFLSNSKYLQFLQNKDILNPLGKSINGDDSSIGAIQLAYSKSNHEPIPVSSHQDDRLYVDEDNAYDWAGYIRWFRGTLQIVTNTTYYTHSHDLMFFQDGTIIYDFVEPFKHVLEEDMLTYGYLLPTWTPLLSRLQCRKAGAHTRKPTMQSMESYHPFHTECVSKWEHFKHMS